jgi:hypothetical protein
MENMFAWRSEKKRKDLDRVSETSRETGPKQTNSERFGYMQTTGHGTPMVRSPLHLFLSHVCFDEKDQERRKGKVKGKRLGLSLVSFLGGQLWRDSR